MRFLHLLLPAAMLLSFAPPAQAQREEFHDYEQWFGVEVRRDPTKHLSLQVQYVCRNSGFVERFKGSYYYIKARQEVAKHLYVDGLIRVVDSFDKNRYRFETGCMYKLKLGKGQFTYRTAYFNERERLAPDNALQHAVDHFWRNRLRYRMDLPSHWQVYGSGETYTHLHWDHITLKRFALELGLDRGIGHGRHLILEYLYQVEYDTTEPVALNALTLGAAFTFNKLRYHRKKDSKGFNDD